MESNNQYLQLLLHAMMFLGIGNSLIAMDNDQGFQKKSTKSEET